MPSGHHRENAASPLEALGISADEERAYRVLLGSRAASAEEVARKLEQPLRKTQGLLEAIEAKGLATCLPERPRRYIASPPQFAVEALITQRQNELSRARATIAELKKEAARGSGAVDGEHMVELITNPAAASQILGQLLQSMQTESVNLQRAPVLFSDLDEAQDAESQVLGAAVSRGARIRSVSDAGFLALPGALKRVRRDVAAGEEARVFPDLPLKLIVVDRRIGLIPLDVHDPQAGPVLLVRASALLDALCALFESFWERATPLVFTPSGELEAASPSARSARDVEQLIPLLAAGLNDKAVAHELGISTATLNRRMAELSRSLDTRTRFQMGWRAALEAFPAGVGAPTRGRRATRPR